VLLGVLGAALVVGVAACGSAPPPRSTGSLIGSSTSRPVSGIATVTPAPASEAAPCLAADLSFGFGDPVEPATGERAVMFRFTSHGSRPCTLDGYPGIELVDADGARLAVRYVHQSHYVSGRAPAIVTLAPGASAYLLVAKYRCDLGDDATATTIRIILPGAAGKVTGPAGPSGGLGLSSCRGGPSDPGQHVAVSPFVAHETDALVP
jgi:hypothetical protein